MSALLRSLVRQSASSSSNRVIQNLGQTVKISYLSIERTLKRKETKKKTISLAN
jgi:hypothetical protein